MDNSIIVIILQIGIVLASAFLIAYVRKKANNYADKNDLKDLTAIVEKEKSKYATDLSLIKAQLDLVTGIKKSYREKEVDAISEFYSVCNWLVYDFLNLDFAIFNSAHYSEIEQKLNEFFPNIKKMTVAKGKFDLFIPDSDLSKAGHDVHMACINYSGMLQQLVLRLKFSIEKQKDIMETFNKYIKSGLSDKEKENIIVREDELLRKEISLYPEEYKKLRDEVHNIKVITAIKVFESSARIYLLKMT
jgi:hypothetical protein